MEESIFIAFIITLLFLWYIISVILDRLPSKKTQADLELAKQKTLELEENKKRNDYETKIKNCELLQAKLQEKIDYQNKIIRDFDKIIEEKCAYYPQLSVIMSDLLTVYLSQSAKFLQEKPHPANAEAKRIIDIKKDMKELIAKCKNLEYQLSYIKLLFPNIMDVFDAGFEEDNFQLETDETIDKTRNYLSDEEYKQLSENERNQLALDRYLISRQKSKWQVGRDYEMYVGYLFEQKGFNVIYNGIIKNIEDMGRDLIAINNLNTYIVQCKFWSQHKEIHEKHIFQLFGTVMLYKISHPFENVFGIFISPNNLSKTAMKVAKNLDIFVIKKDIEDFPRIKCNINRTTKEKIYHLPFDQKYDSVIIEKEKGELIVSTVQEAYDKGFRRAFRHYN